jgi:hypothetical protein
LSVLIWYTKTGWIPQTRRLFCMWQGNWTVQLKSSPYMKFAASSRTQHSPVCRVQYDTVSNGKVTNTLTPRALSGLDVYVTLGC